MYGFHFACVDDQQGVAFVGRLSLAMERGVLLGGLLISASFLLAVALNQAAKESRPDETPAPALPIVKAKPRVPCPASDAPGAPSRVVRTSADCEPVDERRQ